MLEWFLIGVLIALVVGIVWALAAVPAHADDNSKSVTGIPVEYLFLIIGFLGSVVYADMKREVRNLSKDGWRRSKHIRHLETSIRLICNKLNIPYNEGNDDE